MLYINYTAPDGTIHYIESPVLTYVCPTCGETTLFQFSDEFFEDMCTTCNERREKEEAEAMRERVIKKAVNRINRICHSHITEETYLEWCDECRNKLDEEKLSFFRRKYEKEKVRG